MHFDTETLDASDGGVAELPALGRAVGGAESRALNSVNSEAECLNNNVSDDFIFSSDVNFPFSLELHCIQLVKAHRS